jgi:hypothetical protein
VAGHAIQNPTDTWMNVVLELPAKGAWPDHGGETGDVCADAAAYCDARVDRSLTCGTPDQVGSCLADEACLAAMLRDDIACEVRTCETGAPCDEAADCLHDAGTNTWYP